MSDDRKTKLAAYTATQGLRGRRVISPTVDEVVDRIAADLSEAARGAVHQRGVFHLALSGGSTPQVLYRRLMIDPAHRLFPWAHTHVWIVDDRCVEPDDDRYNSKLVRELIVDHVDIPAEQVHYMPVLEPEGDRAYERDLRTVLDLDGRLDFVLLGMGGDGHTASLFPKTPALTERERWVVFNDGELVAEPRPRMTMTYPLINAGRTIAVLVTGAGKFDMLRTVSLATHAGGDTEKLPITGVEASTDDGELVWYLDEAAATGEEAGE